MIQTNNFRDFFFHLLFFFLVFRRYAVKRCSRCHQGITANELVMRAKDLVFHISCFTCASCNKTLTTGDQFGMQDDLIYCRNDYEIIFQGDYFSRMHPAMPCPNGGHLPFYNGVGTAVQKGRPRKRKNHIIDHDGCPPGMGKGFFFFWCKKFQMRVPWAGSNVVLRSCKGCYK